MIGASPMRKISVAFYLEGAVVVANVMHCEEHTLAIFVLVRVFQVALKVSDSLVP